MAKALGNAVWAAAVVAAAVSQAAAAAGTAARRTGQAPVVLEESGTLHVVETEAPTLVVVGHAVIENEPDEARFSVAVEEAGETLEEVADSTAERMERVLDAIRKQGLHGPRVRTTGVDFWPEYRKVGGKRYNQTPEIVGYKAAATIEVKTPDLEGLGETLAAAMDAGANRVGNIRFGASRELARRLRLQAIEHAAQRGRDEAKVAAVASRVRLGGVREVQVLPGGGGGSNQTTLREGVVRGMAEAAEAGIAAMPMAKGLVKVEARVRQVYRVEPLD